MTDPMLLPLYMLEKFIVESYDVLKPVVAFCSWFKYANGACENVKEYKNLS
jgi:hypothetical protein